MTKLIDLTGQRFGRLQVLEKTKRTKGHLYWKCACDCGAITEVSGPNLRSSVTKSCGCLHRESIKSRTMTHGESQSKTYSIWAGIKARCFDEKSSSYQFYGAKGIRLCERWKRFENFLADMGECKEGMSIERIDINGDYEPSNCKWIALGDQAKNRTNTIHIEYQGVTRCLKDWSRITGKPYTTMQLHYRKNYPVEKILGVSV